MRRAQVEKIDGRHVFVDGSWRTCIGNRRPAAGDLVWTDGRCVYGLEQEGGGGAVIQSAKRQGAIPILAYKERYFYQNDRLQDVGAIAPRGWGKMTNSRRNITIYNDWNVLDADFDADGVPLRLERASLSYNRWNWDFYTLSGSCVYRGDEVVRRYDIAPFALAMCREIVYHGPSGEDDPPWLLQGHIEFSGETVGGTVNADGSFQVMVRILYLSLTHPSIVSCPSTLVTEGGFVKYFLFDGTTAEPWCWKRYFLWEQYGAAPNDDTAWLETDAWHAENSSLRYQLPDGWHLTFDGVGDLEMLRWESCRDCVSHVFDPDGTLAFSVPFAPHAIKAVTRIGDGRYLLVAKGTLYRWEDGTLREILDSCENLRLRKMMNPGIWKGMT